VLRRPQSRCDAKCCRPVALRGNLQRTHNWDIWFEAAQLAYSSRAAIVVDTLAVALEIALDGRGVALSNGPFAQDDVAAGRLVQPVQHQVTCPGAWGLICRQESYANERVKMFMDWLAAAHD
jgi:LysR family glycine cleavage system transcriptional activator